MEEREKQADLVAQEELRQKQLKLDHQRRTEEKLQTFLYWAAGLFVIAGVVLAFVFEHKRLGAYLVGCAIACVAIAKTFSQIPDWAWPVLLIAGLLIGFGNSIYTYFVGLFQHPEKLGDYQVVKK
jgi:hypothetical protein